MGSGLAGVRSGLRLEGANRDWRGERSGLGLAGTGSGHKWIILY
jgi:hypothetical protein